MKKIFLLLMSVFIHDLYYGQTFSYNTGVSQPVPSISSLGTYTNVPVSVQTGIPNISYPLVNVPTNNSAINISLALNYHAANVTEDQWSGDLGAGWSLLGQGVISRDNLNDPDEHFDNASAVVYIKNEFDDIYNYSIPGESGKFKFIRNTTDNTFELIKMSPTTSKIEYQRNNNQATLILDSFTITNDKGIKYKFETYNISNTTVWKWGYPWLNSVYSPWKYRSAFFLNSILDENNQELAKFIYSKDIVYAIGTGNQIIESESNKLSQIEIKDRGIINLQYEEKPYTPKYDKYRLRSVSLMTAGNQFVSKYTFEGNGPLEAFNKVDINGNILEKTKFGYSAIPIAAGFAPPVPDGVGIKNIYGAAVLHTVQMPTGGTIQYDFDFVPFFQYEIGTVIPAATEDLGNVNFSKFNNSTKQFFFNITEEKKITISAPVGSLAGYLWNLVFYKKVGSTYQATPYSLGNVYSTDPDNFPEQTTITFTPGEYYATLSSTTAGTFVEPIYFLAAEVIGESTTIQELRSYQRAFPRIKKISYYNEPRDNISWTTIPMKIEEYDYQKFDDPSISSRYFESGGFADDGAAPANPVIIYKNVKVSGDTKGYTKYYFKGTDAYIGNTDTPLPIYYIPNYNLTRDGLLEKKELYNASNQKLSEDLFDYTMEDYPSAEYPIVNNGITGTPYTKTAWIKNEAVISRNYFDSGVTETKTEIFRNTNNYRTHLQRSTAFDGSIQETSYWYPLDKNNQKLISVNMFGIPLETTTVIKKDAADAGKIMARSETKYDNPANKLPSSALAYDSQNILASEVTFNQYDSKGNLEQYTTKDGIPVSVVWGYSNTQPIAKIEGATYSQISSYISDMVTRSNADVDNTSEQALQSALDLFRNKSELANFQITTYVYDPLIGMKSMTPPSGIREIYQYDSAGRLDKITDENGNVLKKYKYNYKQ